MGALAARIDLEINDKKGVENVVTNHLSRLQNVEVTRDKQNITETFPDEQLMAISERPWFAGMANYKAIKVVPKEYTWQQRKCFYKEEKIYLWDDPCLFKISPEGLLRKCVAGKEAENIIWHCHSSAYGGHHSCERTAAKILQSGFWWSTLFNDYKSYVSTCPECNRNGNISKRDEMLLNIMLEAKPFDCLGIDFMGPFPQSNLYIYILA